MTSLKLEYIINEAIKRANTLKHEYLTLESILYVVLDDTFVEDVLESCDVDVKDIREELSEFIHDDTNFSLLTDDEIDELGKRQFADEKVRQIAGQNGVYYQPELTISLQRVLQRSALHVQSSGKNQIMGIHVLVSLFGEEESFALYLLEKAGVDRFDIVQRVAHSGDKPLNDDNIIAGAEGKSLKVNALEEYTENINNLVRESKIDPIVGRKDEILRICQILCRRQKNNPLLIGEAGVGKTAVAHGLAWAIVKNDIPSMLQNTEIYSLDMMSLLSGAKYRGEFEGRFKDVLKELEKICEKKKNVILFIDELHSIMGAGATTGGSLDASSLLKPALTSGKIRCMGSTTYDEYRRFIEKDHAFSRRFQIVDIDEPKADETYQILQGLKPYFEDHHGIKITNPAIKAAVELSEKYITDRKLPDKAIDVIDEAAALMQIKRNGKGVGSLKVKNIEETVAKIAKIPEMTVKSSEKEKLKYLARNLKLLIFGQENAITKVVDSILLSRSGLGNDEKPVASFLFAGPTGVGKTELARQLAFNMGIHFERLDMSEYMEKHSVSKLIGAPPGYVGHDQGGGRLTDSIKQHPYSVLLLDEIEKAHPEIFNILLQIMDHGILTDSHGRNSNFRNTIIIMTTNAGAKDMDAGSISIGDGVLSVNNKRDKAIKNFFTPEFRNRLNDIIHFKSLNHKNIVRIAEKFMMELEIKLANKNIQLVISKDVLEFIAKEGFDAKMGARPILRYIDEHIKRKLSHKLLFGDLTKKGKIKIVLRDNAINFEF